MKSKLLKGILSLVILSVSPFIILAAVGIPYILYQVIGGFSIREGINSFVHLIYSLVPFFPYLTTIPILAVALMFLYKNRKRIYDILAKR